MKLLFLMGYILHVKSRLCTWTHVASAHFHPQINFNNSGILSKQGENGRIDYHFTLLKSKVRINATIMAESI